MSRRAWNTSRMVAACASITWVLRSPIPPDALRKDAVLALRGEPDCRGAGHACLFHRLLQIGARDEGAASLDVGEVMCHGHVVRIVDRLIDAVGNDSPRF